MQSPLINFWSAAPTFINEKGLYQIKANEDYQEELTKSLKGKSFAKYHLNLLFNKSPQKKGEGYYTQTLFFENITQNITLPDNNLQRAINNAFGSLENLKIELKRKAMSIFESGWCFLAIDIYHNLVIVNYSLHQNELIDGIIPILAIDVWEENNYNQYINRGQYLNTLLNIIDWKTVSNHYNNYISCLFYKS